MIYPNWVRAICQPPQGGKYRRKVVEPNDPKHAADKRDQHGYAPKVRCSADAADLRHHEFEVVLGRGNIGTRLVGGA
jgi:hypothetical protein